MAASEEVRDAFGEWVILELMGHRRIAGYLAEQEIAGQGFLRLEIPVGSEGEPAATQFYAPSAVYAIHPVSEELARQAAESMRPAPVSRWELRLAEPAPSAVFCDDCGQQLLPGTGHECPVASDTETDIDPDSMPF